MARELHGWGKTFEAGSDLSSDQFKFVKLASDGQVDVVSTAGALHDGILQDAPAAAGRGAQVIKSGQSKVIVGVGGSTVGARAAIDSSGRAVLARQGEPSVGMFVDAVDVGEVAGIILDDVADSGVRVKKGTITAAQVAALFTTPIEILEAPGAGLYTEVISVHWMLDFESAAYDGAAAGEDLALGYTDASGAQVVNVVDHSGFGDASADAHAVRAGIDVVPVANAILAAHILVGNWFAAAGDSPIHYELTYRTRTLDIS